MTQYIGDKYSNAQILDGKSMAQQWKTDIRNNIINNKYNPCLAIVTDGHDPASKIYIKQKKLACEFCHIKVEIYDAVDDYQIIHKTVQKLNADDSVHGIIVQLPLKLSKYETNVILSLIDPMKDVDGLGSDKYFAPCTPLGIMYLLDRYMVPISGRNVVIINRSQLVGRPLAKMFLNKDATVTVCHSKTNKKALDRYIKNADIIVSAVGNGEFQIDSSLIYDDQVLIDVAMNRDKNGKLYGDFHPDCHKNCRYFTPVPGGVGPMTVAALMNNVRTAYLWDKGFFGGINKSFEKNLNF